MRLPPAALAAGLLVLTGLGGIAVLRARAPAPGLPSAADTAMVSRSIAFFDRRLARDSTNTLLAGQLINRYVLRFGLQADLRDLERATRLAQRALPFATDRSGALARLSGLLLMQHRFAPALEAAERALELDSASAEARGAVLEAALAAGRYQLADRIAATLDPRSTAGRVRRALYLDARGDTRASFQLWRGACNQLQRTASHPAVVAWCLTQLAGLDHALRGPDEARATLRHVLRLLPGYRGAIERLADIALASGESARALRWYRSIESDAHPDLYLRVAEARRALGDTSGAHDAERRFLAVAGRPEREALYGGQLALFYAERGAKSDLDSALALAGREVARRPTSESHDLLAWVHLRRGELAQALAASDRAAEWGEPGPTMSVHRALILAAGGRSGESSVLLAAAASRPTLLAPHARRALDGLTRG
jgi:tetratricopeptide (TPR) repeat protein